MSSHIINKPILAQIISFHRSRLRQFEEIKPDCTSCVSFVQKDQSCAKFNAEIPEEVVTQGCDEWQYDDIPF